MEIQPYYSASEPQSELQDFLATALYVTSRRFGCLSYVYKEASSVRDTFRCTRKIIADLAENFCSKSAGKSTAAIMINNRPQLETLQEMGTASKYIFNMD